MRRHRNRQVDGGVKIFYHPDWVKQYFEDPFCCVPIYLEIAPAGQCNHRCFFCAVDYIKYVNRILDADLLIERIREMAELGVKSVMFAGEGEPTLHREFARICVETRRAGIEVSITTNGTGLTHEFSEQAISSVKWMKVSLDAATPRTHALIHKTSVRDFDRIIRNIEYAVKVRDRLNCDCDIGVQLLLLPQNAHEARNLVRIMRDLGADGVFIKPYSQHMFSINKQEGIIGNTFSYDADFINKLRDELLEEANGEIDVEFRTKAMEAYDGPRGYNICLATPTVWGYVMANLDFYSCSAYLLDPRFLLGNLKIQTFKEIWFGDKRREHLSWVSSGGLDIRECRRNCRPNWINVRMTEAVEDRPSFEQKLLRAREESTPDNVNFI